ncbi:MAG: deoxyribose-phosphate aldolase [Bacilli bacterium]|nr:deoxyribose-phosphate aldolase [Bacilli bacterium]
MNINKYIDHTNLKPYASKNDIEKLCDEAIKNNFASVCVNPYYVGLAHELLIRSCVKVCTVVGFPLGQNTLAVKSFEAKLALEEGADEIDMVINISALKDQNYNYVLEEIKAIRDITKDNILKVIIETCYLNKEEIIKATEICNVARVDFIKTSTGYGIEGAKLEDVELILKHKGEKVEVKASGGIKNYEQAKVFIGKGVTRIGTSNGIEIMEGI